MEELETVEEFRKSELEKRILSTSALFWLEIVLGMFFATPQRSIWLSINLAFGCQNGSHIGRHFHLVPRISVR